MIGALSTCLFFAVTPVFANRAAGLLGSTRANFWRLLAAVLLLGAWAHSIGSGFGGGAFGWFFFGGVIGFGVGGLAMFESLPRLGSNLSTLIVQCGSAVAATLVEWAWLGTRLSAAQITFASMTLAGVVIGLRMGSGASGLGPRVSDPSPPCSARRVGLAWAVLSAIAQGVGAVLSRKAFAVLAALHVKMDPGTAAYQRAVGGLVIAAFALALVAWRRAEPTRSGRRAISWVALNTLTGPVLGVTCYQWALRANPAGIVQPIVAAAPLLTIPFAALFEGSRPRPTYYLGSALAVAGVTGLMLAK